MNSPASSYLADFDSASTLVKALGSFLARKDFPTLGYRSVVKPLLRALNWIPRPARERIYAVSGGIEGVSEKRTHKVDAGRIADWVVRQYPDGRRYPAIVVGSSNGAAIHLCAALGIPWLPQTKLIPIRRRGLHPDDMAEDMERGREPGAQLLERNPELQLHHMHDPNQDRLMIQHMAYFRVKRLTLGKAYENFIRTSLDPGGTIFVLECRLRWPAVRIGERHYFQPGGSGGLEPEEYVHGSPRVEEFLARHGSHRRAWDPPLPDQVTPEAEWGFASPLLEDVLRFADLHGYAVRLITFEDPQDLSPLVADHLWSRALSSPHQNRPHRESHLQGRGRGQRSRRVRRLTHWRAAASGSLLSSSRLLSVPVRGMSNKDCGLGLESQPA